MNGAIQTLIRWAARYSVARMMWRLPGWVILVVVVVYLVLGASGARADTDAGLESYGNHSPERTPEQAYDDVCAPYAATRLFCRVDPTDLNPDPTGSLYRVHWCPSAPVSYGLYGELGGYYWYCKSVACPEGQTPDPVTGECGGTCVADQPVASTEAPSGALTIIIGETTMCRESCEVNISHFYSNGAWEGTKTGSSCTDTEQPALDTVKDAGMAADAKAQAAKADAQAAASQALNTLMAAIQGAVTAAQAAAVAAQAAAAAAGGADGAPAAQAAADRASSDAVSAGEVGAAGNVVGVVAAVSGAGQEAMTTGAATGDSGAFVAGSNAIRSASALEATNTWVQEAATAAGEADVHAAEAAANNAEAQEKEVVEPTVPPVYQSQEAAGGAADAAAEAESAADAAAGAADTNGDGSPDGGGGGTGGTGDGTGTEEQCDPLTSVCETVGEEGDGDVPWETVERPGGYSFGMPATATCPGPEELTFLGQHMEFTYDFACDLAALLRPFVIGGMIIAAIVVFARLAG